MRRLLIVYASTDGQTAAIARRIAHVANAQGMDATEVAVDDVRRQGIDLRSWDLVVVAASVRWGAHQRSIRRFVKRNRQLLSERPNAFVSVSGAAGDPAGVPQAHLYVDRFVAQTEWLPDEVMVFGGAMRYTRLGFITRTLVIAADRRAGRLRDFTRDYEFTDWDAVERFASTLATERQKAHRAR